jgi:hypothetical protein
MGNCDSRLFKISLGQGYVSWLWQLPCDYVKEHPVLRHMLVYLGVEGMVPLIPGSDASEEMCTFETACVQ